MATTNPIVTCRCIFFAGGICFAPSCAGPTSTPARARSKKWRGSSRRSASAGPRCAFCCGRILGFTRDALMTWCEQNDVDYLFGLAKNDRLIAEIAPELAEAAEENRISGKPARRFKDFHYRTHKSWSRQRRVVGKAEWMIPSTAESEGATKPRRKKKSIRVGDIDLATLEGRANPRFVVTSLPADRHQARAFYEETLLRPRRDGKPHQGMSARSVRRQNLHRHHARQPVAAVAVLDGLCPDQRAAPHRPGDRPGFADATCGTIRLKLLKIGAQVPHQRPPDQVLDGIGLSLHRRLSNRMGRAGQPGSLNPSAHRRTPSLMIP